MKIILPLLLCTFFLGCQSTEESDIPTLNETIDSNNDQPPIEEEEQSEETAQVVPVFLEDFPDDWLNLTQYDDEGITTEVIYYYCEAEAPSIHFTPKKGEDWEVYAGFGQDGMIRNVVDFEATSQGIAGNEIITGSFLAVNSDTLPINFEWDVEAKRCKFDGFGYQYPYFVSSENKDFYQSIEEDCEGLWE